jgi:hypothetical protein
MNWSPLIKLASFIAELTTLELCQMLRLIYGPLKAMMIPGGLFLFFSLKRIPEFWPEY